MKVRALAISTVILSLICLSPFSALGQGTKNYAVLKGGVYYPAGDLNRSDGFNFGAGFNGEFAFGRYFYDILALGLGWTFHE